MVQRGMAAGCVYVVAEVEDRWCQVLEESVGARLQPEASWK